jgi:hypothetical protein
LYDNTSETRILASWALAEEKSNAYREAQVATQKKVILSSHPSLILVQLQAEMHGKKAPIYRIVLTGIPFPFFVCSLNS